jgi:REP element-mobilizing transposase RayT
MSRPLRWYLPEVVYDVTTRTIQERFLLRPGEAERDLILGVIGRGLELYARIMLHAFVYLSNHMHMMLSSPDPTQIAPFIGYVNGHVARLVGKRSGWEGPFWSGRAHVIPILDDESAEGRLRYILSNGVKEGLVARPEQWPGASSTPGLLGEPLQGRWPSRPATRASDRRAALTIGRVYDVPLAPLPSWTRMSPVARAERVRAIIDDIVREHVLLRPEPPLGVDKVKAQDPHDRPTEPARSAAPRCHAATPELRQAFRAAYASFRAAYRDATLARENDEPAKQGGFPVGSFGGNRKLVWRTSCMHPWLEAHYAHAAWNGSLPTQLTPSPPAQQTSATLSSPSPPSPPSSPSSPSSPSASSLPSIPDASAIEPIPLTMSLEALRATPPPRKQRRLRVRSRSASPPPGADAPPTGQPQPKPPPEPDHDQASSA